MVIFAGARRRAERGAGAAAGELGTREGRWR